MLISGRHYLREWGINKLLKMGVAVEEEGKKGAHMLRAGARWSVKSAHVHFLVAFCLKVHGQVEFLIVTQIKPGSASGEV